MGGGPCSTRERGTSVAAPGSSPPRNGRNERAAVPVGVVAPLVAGDGGQPVADLVGGPAQRPGRVDDQDLVAGLVQAPEAGAGGGHHGRLGQAQVADGHRAVVLVADGVAVEVLGHVALRSRSSWGWSASSRVSQRAVPIRPEASKASSTTYRPVGPSTSRRPASLPWLEGLAVTAPLDEEILVPAGDPGAAREALVGAGQQGVLGEQAGRQAGVAGVEGRGVGDHDRRRPGLDRRLVICLVHGQSSFPVRAGRNQLALGSRPARMSARSNSIGRSSCS